MKDPIQKYFDVGTIAWMSYPPQSYPLLEAVKKIACDEYLSAIEITHIEDAKVRGQVRDMLAQSHMKVCYGAQPGLLGTGKNPNDIDEERRLEAQKILMDAVDEAQYMGAGGIAFLAGKWEEETKGEAFGQLIKTCENVCLYAAEKKMTVELEVFDYNMDKAALIGPAPLAAEFAAEMRKRCSNFGLLVDLSHFPTTYETSEFVIRTLRPYITHFHIGNAVVKESLEAYGDQHPRFDFPGSANDTPELLDFFRILKSEGFFNSRKPYVLSLEVKPWNNEDGEIILANTKRVINRAWALLED